MKIISVIIPVYNEQQYVWKLLEKVNALDFTHLGYEKELVIVNVGSADKSHEIISEFIAKTKSKTHYINHTNHGKWYSIKKWIEKAIGDVYVVQDADLEYEPSDLITLLSSLESTWWDVCYGSRTRWYKKFWMNYSTVGFLFWGLFVSFLTSLLVWRLVSDEPTCYKMYRKSCKDILLYPKENDFAWEPAVTILLLRDWFSYGEVPIHYYPRKHTQWKKIKLKDGWLAIKTLFVYRLRRLPHHDHD